MSPQPAWPTGKHLSPDPLLSIQFSSVQFSSVQFSSVQFMPNHMRDLAGKPVDLAPCLRILFVLAPELDMGSALAMVCSGRVKALRAHVLLARGACGVHLHALSRRLAIQSRFFRPPIPV